jgi:hypothetical protein
VGDALLVRGIERVRDLDRDVDHAFDRERLRGELVGERLTVEVLHHEERLSLVLADVVHRTDARMVQRRCGARLPFESTHRVGVAESILLDELDRNRSAEACVFTSIDHTHPARSNLNGDSVVRDDKADEVGCQESDHNAPFVVQGVTRTYLLRVPANFSSQDREHYAGSPRRAAHVEDKRSAADHCPANRRGDRPRDARGAQDVAPRVRLQDWCESTDPRAVGAGSKQAERAGRRLDLVGAEIP